MFKRKIAALYTALFVANLGAWAWALSASTGRPLLLGAAALAFGLGLRHALDADHIAAIDNVTRRLMQAGQRPAGVGLFFSLGHSSVVVIATVGAGLLSGAFRGRVLALHQIGAEIGTLVSSTFLLIVAGMNLVVFAAVVGALRRVRRGDLSAAPTQGLVSGPVGRMLRPWLARLTHSWTMFPIGFLFGLGFDTATEIGLLSLSAVESARGLPLTTMLLFPALFTAAMALVDATDSLMMVGVYGWADRHPTRKLYYNLTVTAASVMIALVIGVVQLSGLVGETARPISLTQASQWIEAHSGLAGGAIAAAFASMWLISAWRGRQRRSQLVGAR